MKRLLLTLSMLLLLLIVSSCELFMPPPPKPTIYLLAVGLDYLETKNHLDGTIPDTVELAAALYYRGKEMGVEVNLTLMLQEIGRDNTDPKLDPTRDNIFAQIERLQSEIGTNDIFIFYFAGHGNAEGSLVVGDGLIETEELLEQLDTIKATKLLILDSCYSGAHEVPYPRSPKSRETNLTYNPSQFFLLASKADKESYETHHPDSHGYLTLILLEALGWDHAGSSEIVNSDSSNLEVKGHIPLGSRSLVERGGNIYLSDLYAYIRGYRNSRGQRPQTGKGPIDLILFSRHW